MHDNVLDVVNLGRFIRDNRSQTAGAFFPATTVPANDPPCLEQTARNWLLEIGTRDFETSLATRAVPEWMKWPDLA